MPRQIQLTVGFVASSGIAYQRTVADNVGVTEATSPVLSIPEAGTHIPATIPFTVGA